MQVTGRFQRLILAAVAIAGVVGVAPPANAQGFFEQLFGNGFYEAPRSRPLPRGIQVKSPQYFDYQPDRMTRLNTAKLSNATVSDLLPEDLRQSAFVLARDHLADLNVRTFPEVSAAISSYYGLSPKFMWLDNGRLNVNAMAALEVLKSADRWGLTPSDYELVAGTPTTNELSPKDALQFELNLSARVLEYALDAIRGRVAPNRLSGYHDIPRKNVDLFSTMLALAESKDSKAFLEGLHPQNSQFKSLTAELRVLRETDKENQVRIDLERSLRPGDLSSELPAIVVAISHRGSKKLLDRHRETLARYSDQTTYSDDFVELVKDFQDDNGLTADGIIGPNTVAALVPDTAQEKIAKVELALERLRWLRDDLGKRYVFINQPEFVATYVEEGKEPLSMRAIVGKKSNQTSFFVDQIETVEYNPYWGVPYSIIVNEMLPKLSRDPSYLDRLGYEVSTPRGYRVSSYDVDWYAVATKRESINVRQPPGRSNALGAVKILFPNKHDIYMHDTPDKSLFASSRRAFSHGCVRLQRPREMAAAVLGKSVAYVDQRIAGGSNEQEQLNAPIPVYVAYFTAWPGQDGKIVYSDDVYDRDTYLARAIKRTVEERKRADL